MRGSLGIGDVNGRAHPKFTGSENQGVLPEHDARGHPSVRGERFKRLSADVSRVRINQHNGASGAGLNDGQLN